jgi:hypothetical protein
VSGGGQLDQLMYRWRGDDMRAAEDTWQLTDAHTVTVSPEAR